MSLSIESLVVFSIKGCKSFSLRILRLWFIVFYLPAPLLWNPMLFLILHLLYVTIYFSPWKCDISRCSIFVWICFHSLYQTFSNSYPSVLNIFNIVFHWQLPVFLFSSDFFLELLLLIYKNFWADFLSFVSVLSHFPSLRHFVLCFLGNFP